MKNSYKKMKYVNFIQFTRKKKNSYLIKGPSLNKGVNTIDNSNDIQLKEKFNDIQLEGNIIDKQFEDFSNKITPIIYDLLFLHSKINKKEIKDFLRK